MACEATLEEFLKSDYYSRYRIFEELSRERNIPVYLTDDVEHLGIHRCIEDGTWIIFGIYEGIVTLAYTSYEKALEALLKYLEKLD